MYATDFVQVGTNIQKKLDNMGKTQQNLADALGISRQVMNKIIKGSKAINVTELSKIAMILGTTTDDLLTVENYPVKSDDLAFMGNVTDDETMEKINTIRSMIDEICLLEELIDA